MKILFRYIVFLTCAFLIVILIASLIGHLRPTMPLATFMTHPDGTACDRPCIFGIIPGVTTAEQAEQLLSEHPLTRDGKWNLTHQLLALPDKKTFVALGLTDDRQMVDVVNLTDTPYDSGIPVPGAIIDTSVLGEFILRYGKPVIGLPGSNYFVVEYPHIGIVAALARPYELDKYVDPYTPMATLMISNLQPCKNPFYAILHHWMGFIRMQSYFDDTQFVKVAYRNSPVPYPPPYLHCDVQRYLP